MKSQLTLVYSLEYTRYAVSFTEYESLNDHEMTPQYYILWYKYNETPYSLYFSSHIKNIFLGTLRWRAIILNIPLIFINKVLVTAVLKRTVNNVC